jgi:hypothetical protein
MPQGGATLEQAASVRHYLMKEPLSGDVLKSHRLFGLGGCPKSLKNLFGQLP